MIGAGDAGTFFICLIGPSHWFVYFNSLYSLPFLLRFENLKKNFGQFMNPRIFIVSYYTMTLCIC